MGSIRAVVLAGVVAGCASPEAVDAGRLAGFSEPCNRNEDCSGKLICAPQGSVVAGLCSARCDSTPYRPECSEGWLVTTCFQAPERCPTGTVCQLNNACGRAPTQQLAWSCTSQSAADCTCFLGSSTDAGSASCPEPLSNPEFCCKVWGDTPDPATWTTCACGFLGDLPWRSCTEVRPHYGRPVTSCPPP